MTKKYLLGLFLLLTIIFSGCSSGVSENTSPVVESDETAAPVEADVNEILEEDLSEEEAEIEIGELI